MNKYAVILCLLCIQVLTSIAQPVKQVNGDLQSALKIFVNQTYTFKKTAIGYGDLKEFKISVGRSPYIFREERNTRWYIIQIPFDGILSFDIKPHNINDDYDWMLYKQTVDLGKMIEAEKTSPIRSNNSRNDKHNGSLTGLKDGFTNLFSKPGIGKTFSKPLVVNAGDNLALVIDNIYKNGEGFDLIINLKPNFKQPFVTLDVAIKDMKLKSPLAAEITVTDDSTGVIINKLSPEKNSGMFKLLVPGNRPLSFTAYHPKYLFNTENFTATFTDTNKLEIYLDTLAPGKKLVLYNIHFLANKDEILPGAQPELDRILRFLKEHADWQVKLVGHTNNNVFADTRYLQQLSFNRALTVKKYLLSHAIPEKRLSCAGMGGKSPLFVTNDPVKGLKNSRVEVVLVGK